MAARSYDQTDIEQPRRAATLPTPALSPILPKSTIAGRALIAVVAIMTFLAALTTGAVTLVQATASEWQADVSREVTVQVRPINGRDIQADVDKAAGVIRGVQGVADVRPYTRDESAKLLEPWLGTGLSLDDLPVPRIIVVKTAPDWVVDFAQLRTTLAEQVPGATLDDHRGWIERMRTVTQTAVAGGLLILALVIVATILSVTFATHGAMATNRPIIEVLHFIGARHGFIASHFQRHFLVLGLKGGAIGGGCAILVFVVMDLFGRWLLHPDTAREVAALFGSFSLGIWGYVLVLAQIPLIAVVTAVTSRRTVNRTLNQIE